jgi:hypothetical protein
MKAIAEERGGVRDEPRRHHEAWRNAKELSWGCRRKSRLK